MRGALAKARTYWRLGPANLLRVAAYRALLRAGVYRRRLPIATALAGPMFDWSAAGAAPAHPAATDPAAWDALARRVRAGELPVFSHHWADAGFPPAWRRSVITQVEHERPFEHWTTLPDFGLPGGDVKGYWEPARFDGLLILVLGWLCTRRDDLRQAIDAWWASWNADNPANAGLQWKCGQETGLRLMQGLLAAELLRRWGGVTVAPAFSEWVAQHARRIAPTMLYAVGQDNNHGSSEAAALFCAGSFLARRAEGRFAREAEAWRVSGRHWLANRIERLVMADGSFAQHSVNYHRVMLDTCAFAETWRRWHDEPAFAPATLERCAAATRWLAAFTDADSGDAPNLGANDGARLFVLDRSAYRDFRPSVRWAARLFLDHPGAAPDERLGWLGLDSTAASAAAPVRAAALRLWPDGGYAKLSTARAWALLRLPRYRFRPSHADALHLDLWVGGENLLRDGGSYSYNTEDTWLRYFSGTASHNTVQFDGRDQMPRVSRFLYGDWLECAELHADAAAGTLVAAYRDASGARHRRRVTLGVGRCTVVDEVSGFHRRAVLRWRIAPSGRPARFEDAVWSDDALRIAVRSTVPIARAEPVEGWESRYYTDRNPLPVIEVEVASDATLTTEITWPA